MFGLKQGSHQLDLLLRHAGPTLKSERGRFVGRIGKKCPFWSRLYRAVVTRPLNFIVPVPKRRSRHKQRDPGVSNRDSHYPQISTTSPLDFQARPGIGMLLGHRLRLPVLLPQRVRIYSSKAPYHRSFRSHCHNIKAAKRA